MGAHLRADEVADDVHGRATPDAELDESGAETAGLLVDEVGVLDEGQIVERHDDGGPGGRHPVVGRVHHVDATGPALDARAPAALPQGVDVPCRQDGTGDAHPRGTRRRIPPSGAV